MDDPVRDYLASIGRKGGTRSRRRLSSDQARSMTRTREARRALREFVNSSMARTSPPLPGADIVEQGLAELASQHVGEAACLVSIAAPRLELLGVRVPFPISDPEDRLYQLLQERHGDAAHGRYNALIRRLVSFARAATLANA